MTEAEKKIIHELLRVGFVASMKAGNRLDYKSDLERLETLLFEAVDKHQPVSVEPHFILIVASIRLFFLRPNSDYYQSVMQATVNVGLEWLREHPAKTTEQWYDQGQML